MQGVALVRLVDRHHVLLAVPGVAAAVQAIRPGGQHLPAHTADHLVGVVAVEHGHAADLVHTQAAAVLDHHGVLVAVPDLDLLS